MITIENAAANEVNGFSPRFADPDDNFLRPKWSSTRSVSPIRPRIIQPMLVSISSKRSLSGPQRSQPSSTSFIGIAGIASNTSIQSASIERAEELRKDTKSDNPSADDDADEDELIFTQFENLSTLNDIPKSTTNAKLTSLLFTRGINSLDSHELFPPKNSQRRKNSEDMKDLTEEKPSETPKRRLSIPRASIFKPNCGAVRRHSQFQTPTTSKQIALTESPDVLTKISPIKRVNGSLNELPTMKTRRKSDFITIPKGRQALASFQNSFNHASDQTRRENFEEKRKAILNLARSEKELTQEPLKPASLEEQDNEIHKFLLDLKFWKVVPVSSHTYFSESYASVLPAQVEKLMKEKEEQELNEIRDARLQSIILPQRRKNDDDEDEEDNMLSGRKKKLLPAVPIRKRGRKSKTATKLGQNPSMSAIPSLMNVPSQSKSRIKEVSTTVFQGKDNGTMVDLNTSIEKQFKKGKLSPNKGGSLNNISKCSSESPRNKTKNYVNTEGLGLDYHAPAEEVPKELEIIFPVVRNKIKEAIGEGEDEVILNTEEQKTFNIEEAYVRMRVKIHYLVPYLMTCDVSKVQECKQKRIINHNFSAPQVLNFKFDIITMNMIRKAMSPLRKEYQIWFPGIWGLVILQNLSFCPPNRVYLLRLLAFGIKRGS